MFYEPALAPNLNEIFLNEQESRHALKVLRHKEGDTIELTDGRGYHYKGLINKIGKKQCQVTLMEVQAFNPPEPAIHLAIAPLKNRNRMEWIVEKATELGVQSLAFIHTQNAERAKVNEDRVDRILISALKQSLRVYKPACSYWSSLQSWLNQIDPSGMDLYTAECETPEKPYLSRVCEPGKPLSLLFGPEGDLSPQEITESQKAGFQGVSLGDLRLRTETAVITGLSMVHGVNQKGGEVFH